MYALLDAPSRKANPEISFLADYRRANKAAGVEKITIGTVGPLLSGGIVRVPVSVKTKDFGTLKGTLKFHATQTGDIARVAWSPEQVLPGVRKGEEVRRRSGAAPKRGSIYDAGGRLLNSDPTGASIAGVPGAKPTGLERIYDDRLSGRRTSSLYFGDRVVARVKGRRGRSVNTTIRLGLQKTAQSALGDKLGGIAVIKPSDGSVLALAGIAVSAPQPPGSSFKIITAAAALQEGVAKVSSTYPVRTSATLSGVKLRNAERRAVRRQPEHLVRALLQLGLRPDRRQARRQEAGRRRRALRLQRGARGPRGQDEHDPRGQGPQGQPRGRRQRDRPEQGPRDAARDGLGRRDDRQPRRPRAPAHRRQQAGPQARGQRQGRRRRCAT